MSPFFVDGIPSDPIPSGVPSADGIRLPRL